jgi:hypothetical protein
MRPAVLAVLAVLALAGLPACGVGSLDADDGGDDGTVPPDGDCRALLDGAGVAFSDGPAMPGVDDPVTVELPIAGVAYRVLGAAAPRTTLFMDCGLAGTLVRMAPLLVARDVVELVDLGVYNYRCIGGGTPPDCPNGVSQHAYARAIDVAGYTTADGTTYSVLDDWVIDEGDDTCAAATENDRDEFLHDLFCAQIAAGLWGVALTPNYNADHRNHFHLDLTAGDPFVRRGTRSSVEPHEIAGRQSSNVETLANGLAASH